MSRNIKIIAFGLVILSLLGGCGSLKQEAEIIAEDKATEQVSAETAALETTEQESTESEASVAETSEPDSEFDPIPIYKAFLNNEEVAEISFAADQGQYSSFRKTMEDGGKYTLDEIIQGLKHGINDYFEATAEIEVKEIRKEYIDCGNDGQEELVVAVKLKEPVELYENKMIFKATETGLKLCYASDSWSRKRLSVNEYGFITDRYYTGGRFGRLEFSLVDAEGNWHFIAGGNPITLTELDESWSERNKSELDKLGIDPDAVVLERFYLEKPEPGEEPSFIKADEVSEKHTYKGDMSEEERDKIAKKMGPIEAGELIYATDEYGDLMSVFGVDTCSEIEAVEMISDNIKSDAAVIFTELQNGKEVLSTPVDF